MFDELIERTDPLAEVRQNNQVKTVDKYPKVCAIELTLNYPRTPKFLNSNSAKQKKLYLMLYDEIIHTFGKPRLLAHDYAFELCKSGQVHMHALIYYKMPKEYYPIGVVSDLVKEWLNCLPKKYGSFNENNLHTGFLRYRCPSIVVQYDDPETDMERIGKWDCYMKKNSNIVI